MTHVFIGYKIKQGGEGLVDGVLTVNFTDSSMVLENSQTGEILTQVDFSSKIDPVASSWTCTVKRIDIKVKKAVEDVNWRMLEAAPVGSAVTAAAIPAQVPSGSKPSYPSSSKVKRDWNAVDKEIETELKKDPLPKGGDAMGGLWKILYESSDDDTRRAMVKSYQTSGGTVFNTSWSDVKDKDYEGADRPEAPKG